MARYVGMIGFNKPVDNGDGRIIPTITEEKYTGHLISVRNRVHNDSSVNQDVVLTTEVSVILSPEDQEHMYDIVYVVWRGIPWSVVSVSETYPRVTLSLGSRYNGKTA